MVLEATWFLFQSLIRDKGVQLRSCVHRPHSHDCIQLMVIHIIKQLQIHTTLLSAPFMRCNALARQLRMLKRGEDCEG